MYVEKFHGKGYVSTGKQDLGKAYKSCCGHVARKRRDIKIYRHTVVVTCTSIPLILRRKRRRREREYHQKAFHESNRRAADDCRHRLGYHMKSLIRKANVKTAASRYLRSVKSSDEDLSFVARAPDISFGARHGSGERRGLR
jgi:hypothetical protein